MSHAIASGAQAGSVRSTVLLCLCFVAVVLVVVVISATREPLLSVEEMRTKGTFVLPRPRELGPFELTQHTGGPFTQADLEGRWSFVFFGFTNCPDVCPVAMSVLANVQRSLADAGETTLLDQFNVVLVSVDPERDTTRVMAEYVSAFSERFTGVTGTREAIAVLGTQLNIAFMKVPSDVSPDGYVVDHTGNIVIINPMGHYHGFIKLPHDPDNILLSYRSIARNF
jgi:protein SCO1/2